MILQRYANGHIAISQNAHAWVSGQMARLWGNAQFATFAPFEPICYGAEQHDIGFLEWERNPTLNLMTGLPHTYEDLPVQPHLQLWHESVVGLYEVSAYAALLTSLHFSGLCERFHRKETGADKVAVDAFLETQRVLQRKIIEKSKLDPEYSAACQAETLRYHRDLLAVWDFVSLRICREPQTEFSVPDVPRLIDETTMLKFDPTTAAGPAFQVTPWPFRSSEVQLTCEGRFFEGRFSDEQALRKTLSNAPRINLTTTLRAG
jgi:Protein of unknown function (DUF3891)